MPHMLDDPAEMTPSQRRRAIAAILARQIKGIKSARWILREDTEDVSEGVVDPDDDEDDPRDSPRPLLEGDDPVVSVSHSLGTEMIW